MVWQKVTHGHVIQRFDGEECIFQHFTAGDIVECECEAGTLQNPPEHNYQPYDMIQPVKGE